VPASGLAPLTTMNVVPVNEAEMAVTKSSEGPTGEDGIYPVFDWVTSALQRVRASGEGRELPLLLDCSARPAPGNMLRINLSATDHVGMLRDCVAIVFQKGLNILGCTVESVVNQADSMVVLVATPQQAQEVKAELEGYQMRRRDDQVAAFIPGKRCVLRFFGRDRTGLLYEVTDLLCERGINIVHLRSETVGEEVSMDALVDWPEGKEPAMRELETDLGRLGKAECRLMEAVDDSQWHWLSEQDFSTVKQLHSEKGKKMSSVQTPFLGEGSVLTKTVQSHLLLRLETNEQRGLVNDLLDRNGNLLVRQLPGSDLPALWLDVEGALEDLSSLLNDLNKETGMLLPNEPTEEYLLTLESSDRLGIVRDVTKCLTSRPFTGVLLGFGRCGGDDELLGCTTLRLRVPQTLLNELWALQSDLLRLGRLNVQLLKTEN
jgi:predicted amino acid-binding ACT domain protein